MSKNKQSEPLKQDAVIYWVAVSEKLPIVDKLVLCARKDRGVRIESSIGYMRQSGRFTCAFDWVCVDYWAEIPEPPCI